MLHSLPKYDRGELKLEKKTEYVGVFLSQALICPDLKRPAWRPVHPGSAELLGVGPGRRFRQGVSRIKKKHLVGREQRAPAAVLCHMALGLPGSSWIFLFVDTGVLFPRSNAKRPRDN